jgi:hypothetical protein
MPLVTYANGSIHVIKNSISKSLSPHKPQRHPVHHIHSRHISPPLTSQPHPAHLKKPHPSTKHPNIHSIQAEKSNYHRHRVTCPHTHIRAKQPHTTLSRSSRRIPFYLHRSNSHNYSGVGYSYSCHTALFLQVSTTVCKQCESNIFTHETENLPILCTYRCTLL